MPRSPKSPARPPRRVAQATPTREFVSIEKLVAGGAGFARRSSGEPVFVRGALPGDEVQLREVSVRKGYSEAKAWALVSPSPDRRDAPCPYANHCGGCDLMSLTEAAQSRVKRELLIEILRRTAHVDAGQGSATPLVWEDFEHGEKLGYRSRIRLHVDDTGRLGFFGDQSHVVVAVQQCLVATDRVNSVLRQLANASRERPEWFRPFEQIEVRALGEVSDLVWTPRRAAPKERPPRSNLPNAAARQAVVRALDDIARHLHANLGGEMPHMVLSHEAPERWREFVQGVELTNASAPGVNRETLLPEHAARLYFAPGTFTQVNWGVNRRIVADMCAHLQRGGARRFLDLYCGAGNFSLPLLALGLKGVGVENNPTSIAAATLAASRQQLGGEFVARDVLLAVEQLIAQGRTFDVIILDPPRAGFKEVAALLHRLAPKFLFVCACDPVTFARDLRCLTDGPFALRELKAYDMFPQTHHVECTAWLTAKPAVDEATADSARRTSAAQ
jgi:23S rRNA (uracil1939-C5)-methyltransferase